MLTRSALIEIYRNTRTVAVVGASSNEDKPANAIPGYLASQGFRMIPVRPQPGELFGVEAVPSLDAIEEPIDVVEVFRPGPEVPDIARAAVKAGAPVLWLQPGIRSEEGERIAREAGLTVVVDRCMGMTHGELGLGPGPYG